MSKSQQAEREQQAILLSQAAVNNRETVANAEAADDPWDLLQVRHRDYLIDLAAAQEAGAAALRAPVPAPRTCDACQQSASVLICRHCLAVPAQTTIGRQWRDALSDVVDLCIVDGSSSSWKLCLGCETESHVEHDRQHGPDCAVAVAERLLREWHAVPAQSGEHDWLVGRMEKMLAGALQFLQMGNGITAYQMSQSMEYAACSARAEARNALNAEALKHVIGILRSSPSQPAQTTEKEMPVCVKLARARLEEMVRTQEHDDAHTISARDAVDMLSGVVLEYETLFASLAPSPAQTATIKQAIAIDKLRASFAAGRNRHSDQLTTAQRIEFDTLIAAVQQSSSRQGEAQKQEYDFEHEAQRVIDAIEPQRGALMTVVCALHEAYDASGQHRQDWDWLAEILQKEHGSKPEDLIKSVEVLLSRIEQQNTELMRLRGSEPRQVGHDARVLAAAKAGYKLSTYAASVRTDGGSNTREWLTELFDRIEETQSAAAAAGIEAPPGTMNGERPIITARASE